MQLVIIATCLAVLRDLLATTVFAVIAAFTVPWLIARTRKALSE